jgi:hypothetical protein
VFYFRFGSTILECLAAGAAALQYCAQSAESGAVVDQGARRNRVAGSRFFCAWRDSRQQPVSAEDRAARRVRRRQTAARSLNTSPRFIRSGKGWRDAIPSVSLTGYAAPNSAALVEEPADPEL